MYTDAIVNATGYVNYSPPIDYLGIAGTNVVIGELHTISNDGSTTQCYIKPTYSPFYSSGVIINSAANGIITGTLLLNIDYVFVFPFISASRATGATIYGAIQFINPNYSGQVIIKYQSLGGNWVSNAISSVALINSNVVTTNYAINTLASQVTWEQVAGYTSQFPIVSTPWDKADVTNMDAVNQAVSVLRSGIVSNVLSLNLTAEIAHLANFSNPHSDTSTSVGLNLVANLPPATNNQAADNTNNSVYISAAQLVNLYSTFEFQATTTQAGTGILNVGTTLGDDTDTTKILTAAGLVTMLANPLNNFGGVVNRVQGTAMITPWALPSSWHWRGVQYSNLSTFITAIAAYVGVSTLEYNSSTGQVWFPPYAAIPSLVTSA